jgi:regulatory protein YycI of two-component signal transduction system YycFG
MQGDRLWQFMSFASIFLLVFFLLVLNINFYTSSLIQENTKLQARKQTLENSLQTTRVTSNTNLEREIEKNVEIGNITRIDSNQSINILNIQNQPLPDPAQVTETPSQTIPSSNPSVTIR